MILQRTQEENAAGFELFKDKHGFVIGGMEGSRYREYELQLSPGDKLFVYTDGVPEATDANGELFGTERMVQAQNTCAAEAPRRSSAGCASRSTPSSATRNNSTI